MRAGTAIAIVLSGCGRDSGGGAVEIVSGGGRAAPEAALTTDLAALKDARILFGHQSVGRNILDGLKVLASRHGVELRLEEADPGGPRRPGIEEFRVGRNEDPASKCRDFLRVLAAAADGYDAVMMKFCYVDFYEDADVDAVFGAYRDLVAKARAAAPSAVFVHATVPLMEDTPGPAWKTRIKRILGRDPHGEANARRNAFNERLLAGFPGEPVFDIARHESTLPDGRRTAFTKGGKSVYTLAPAYTYDGGHLNEAGKERLAAEFARVLASSLRPPSSPGR